MTSVPPEAEGGEGMAALPASLRYRSGYAGQLPGRS
jgi:hypothetical protein